MDISDKVPDSSNWKQLGLVVCYTQNNKPIERLLEFEFYECILECSDNIFMRKTVDILTFEAYGLKKQITDSVFFVALTRPSTSLDI
ncbi:hypothetical protein KUTeg_022504 [Tegillarca granosa]|uniref:Uncharacterized protein n=1 Tax=Tegillarca granosa TaxID=220873 RepID=A0ABQ9EBV8_TEGGR|nr:hypothetical protein KUTeg_022504 [Tegillarca granosa]